VSSSTDADRGRHLDLANNDDVDATIEHVAGDLARNHLQLERARGRTPLFADLVSMAARFDAIHMRWGSAQPEEPAHRKASEWFLDNEYLFRRVLRQVKEEFPTGFQRRLPVLAAVTTAAVRGGDVRHGEPRLVVVARKFLETVAIDFDATALRKFLDAYQEV
jgi:hypothetical protein